jgi:hypothetical protein
MAVRHVTERIKIANTGARLREFAIMVFIPGADLICAYQNSLQGRKQDLRHLNRHCNPDTSVLCGKSPQIVFFAFAAIVS